MTAEEEWAKEKLRRDFRQIGCKTEAPVGYARASAGVRAGAGASLLDGQAYAQCEDGCQARPASTSESAGMDLSGHQPSAHREAVHGDADAPAHFFDSTGTPEGALVMGSFVSAACVLSWRDALARGLSTRLEHVSRFIFFAPAHHLTGSFCLYGAISSTCLSTTRTRSPGVESKRIPTDSDFRRGSRLRSRSGDLNFDRRNSRAGGASRGPPTNACGCAGCGSGGMGAYASTLGSVRVAGAETEGEGRWDGRRDGGGSVICSQDGEHGLRVKDPTLVRVGRTRQPRDR
ncbi:hypothetical protein K438DRAFT_2002592 [Mycena galopus ATCC 62051]|nr:hypothetical protein K438DRAFT_2002592 [Mycena galopus ATCC 62051]